MRQNRKRLPICLGLAIGCFFSLVADNPCRGQYQGNSEDRLLRHLWSQGLGETAIRYVRARRELERDRDAVAWWVLREMECLAQIALSRRSEADRLWAECRSVAEDYRKAVETSGGVDSDARWPWIQWQLGRCKLLDSQAALAVYLANPANSVSRDRALNLVREVLQDMESLQTDIKRRQPLAARQGLSGGSQAPTEQLRDLSADAQLLRCEALLVRSRLYPEGSSDRAAALAEVLVLVRDVLDRTGDDWLMRPALTLAKATADLEMGDEAALLTLEQLAASASVPQVRMLAGVAFARGLAIRGHESRARAAMDGLELLASEEPEVAPNWLLARIEIALMGLDQQSEDVQQKLISELADQSRQLGKQFGDYWRTRAEALIVGRVSSDQVSDSRLASDLLIAEVRQLTAAGLPEEAVQKLAMARDAQARLGNGLLALEFANLAAALLRHLEKWDDAADALETIALQFSPLAESPEAQMWAIRARAEAVRLQPQDSATGDAYYTALLNYLSYWPEAESASEVADWLLDWCRRNGGRQKFVEASLSVLQSLHQVESADLILSRFYEQIMLVSDAYRKQQVAFLLEDQAQFASAEVKQATKMILQAAVAMSEGGGLPVWSPREEIDTRIRTLQAWLDQPDKTRLTISRLLETSVALDRMRIGQPMNRDSRFDFNALSPSCRMSAAPAITALLDSSSGESRSEIWKLLGLQVDWPSGLLGGSDTISEQLGSSASDIHASAKDDRVVISPISRVALMRIALLLGHESQFDLLMKTVQSQSKNGTIQLMLAFHLLASKDHAEATRIATRVAALSSPGSPLHLSARWCLMRCQVESGQHAEASQSAQLILATQPGLDELWKTRLKQIALP